MKYHKIQSVYKRDPNTNHKTFLEGQFTLKSFEYLKDAHWVWTEKVHGQNIRIYFDGENEVIVHGRGDNAQLHTMLVKHITDKFTPEAFKAAGIGAICLYGEGYGAGINKGGDYRDDKGFILFDALCGDMYLERHSLEDISSKLECPIVPILGEGTLMEAIEFVRNRHESKLKDTLPEGIVLRTKEELTDRFGNRMITKIKHIDFGITE